MMITGRALGSTYAVYIPLDSSIYRELEELNGLGYLETYLEEIKPITRIEAARLTLEAEHNISNNASGHPGPERLGRAMVQELRLQLPEEVKWLEHNQEDDLPTMFHPVQRVETQYIFSRGPLRRWQTSVAGQPGDAGINAQEVTPLFPNNNGLPTSPGSNEIARWSGWAGAGGFLTAYGEGALSGPMTRGIPGINRLQPLGSAVVASLGNFAISFGTEEMRWGTGYFGALSNGNNASPFPAIRFQSIHPTVLPWIFKYLGQFRFQTFFGQLDGDRYYAHPWIDGQIFSFKPLPTFEIGFTHTIDFGGRHNDNYDALGFLGRATGIATGSPTGANTNSRGGVYLKFYFPSLRNLQVYQEILGEDNLTDEVPVVGKILPFLAVSYQGGFYLPRLTADGLTDLRFEYAILEPNYSVHSDSLYWTYESQLMGDPMGPNASEVDVQIGRWLNLLTKVDVDFFYTVQAPTFGQNAPYPAEFYPYVLAKEHSGGVAIDFFRFPSPVQVLGDSLAATRARVAVEYASDLNYQSGTDTVRIMLMLSGSFMPGWPSWTWN